MNNNINQSCLSYFGSKKKLLNQILPLLPNNINNFYDLFGGSGTVSLNIESKSTVYYDNFKEVVELFNYIKENDINKCIEFIEDIVNKYNLPNKEGFYKLRDDFNSLTNPNPLYIYIFNYFAFSGRLRFNSSNKFNASCGGLTKKFGDDGKNKLINFKKVITDKDIQFNYGSYNNIQLNTIKENDFIYLDPPYLITDCAFYRTGWTEDDEIKFIEFLQELVDRNIKFGLSNVLTYGDLINKYLQKFIEVNNNKIVCHSLEYKYTVRKTADNPMKECNEILVVSKYD